MLLLLWLSALNCWKAWYCVCIIWSVTQSVWAKNQHAPYTFEWKKYTLKIIILVLFSVQIWYFFILPEAFKGIFQGLSAMGHANYICSQKNRQKGANTCPGQTRKVKKQVFGQNISANMRDSRLFPIHDKRFIFFNSQAQLD